MTVVSTTITSIRAPESGVDARTLDRLVHSAGTIEGIWSDAVQPGDWIVIRTKNSVYSLAALGKGRYRVVGGWFRARGLEDEEVRVNGCTWGGTTIHTRLIAAVGMYLEFDNGVRTTRIREISLIRGGDEATAH